MWNIILVVCAIFLVSCKTPKPKPLDKVKDKNISINFNVNYKPSLYQSGFPYSSLTIDLDMRDDKSAHIQIGYEDKIHAYLNGTEYQLETVYCSDLYGPQYFCGYRFPYINDDQVANLIQPLSINLEMQRSKGQLITATASLPRFFTMTSSVSTDKKYDPLTDALLVTWVSTVPVRQVEYMVGQYEHSVCYATKIGVPQLSDTYIQYGANELSLDLAVCNPMSYARIAADTVESVTAMQTNVMLAAANIKLNQRVFLSLLNEPFNP